MVCSVPLRRTLAEGVCEDLVAIGHPSRYVDGDIAGGILKGGTGSAGVDGGVAEGVSRERAECSMEDDRGGMGRRCRIAKYLILASQRFLWQNSWSWHFQPVFFGAPKHPGNFDPQNAFFDPKDCWGGWHGTAVWGGKKRIFCQPVCQPVLGSKCLGLEMPQK